ncbi:MAG: hypothetical protein JSU65_14480, partial [Candidatus Zixiibacteriota bacterium]
MTCLRATRLILVMAFLTAVVGCSSDSPTELTNTTSTLDQNAGTLTSPPETRVQITAHLATIDADERLLTFDEVTEVVFVPEDCPIVRVEAGIETPLEFADLQVGDYLKVCGILEDNGIITACKVVVYIESACDGYDVIIRDSIATIDVAAGSFTVHGRAETIVVDENTEIWAIIPYQY